MNYPRILICIFAMSIVTYLIRMLPLTFFKKEIKSNYINSFFAYIPYAVLSAMTFPEILYSTGNLISALFGGVTAVFLAFKNKSMLTVALSSCAVVFIVEKIMCII